MTLEQIGDMAVPAADPYFVPRLRAGLLVEPELLNAAIIHVGDWRRAVDVGAHIGCWTLELARRFDRVVAFEPHPENFAALSRNACGRANVRLLPMAVADRSTACRLSHAGRINSGERHLSAGGDGPMVPVAPLDSFAMSDVGLIKLDVEGSEELALRGGEQTIRRCKPVIVLEEHALNPQDGAARALLGEWGAAEVFRFESYPTVFDIVMAWPDA